MRQIIVLITASFMVLCFAFQINECANVPQINKKIVAYLKTKIGKAGGDYCHDIFENAYKAVGLEYNDYYLGEKIDYSKDCVYPGDVITLEKLELSWKRNDSTVGLVFDQKLEYFIYKVKRKGAYTVVRSEVVNNKLKVISEDIEINNSKKGKPKIFRPTKK